MKFKNWFKVTFKNKAILRTLRESDDDAYRYILDEEMIDKSEIPKDARRCRGEPHYWSLNLIENKNDGHDPDGYSASNAYRWLHTDAYDNLLSGLWKEGDHINLVKILTIIGIVVAVCIGAYIVFGGKA